MSPNGVFCPGDSQLITSDSQNQDNNGKKSVSPAKPGLWREISVNRILILAERVFNYSSPPRISLIFIYSINVYRLVEVSLDYVNPEVLPSKGLLFLQKTMY